MMARSAGHKTGKVSEGIAAQFSASPVLRKMSEVASATSGLVLVVLLRTDHQMVELCPTDGEGGLPCFCRVYRSTSQGKTHCLTCRSLVAFAAVYRNLVEYTCHGGVSVVAAPALRPDGTTSDRVVVAACAFADANRERGWRLARKHAAELRTAPRQLKTAYDELPSMTEERRSIVKKIVAATASALGEIEARTALQSPNLLDESGSIEPTQEDPLISLPALLAQSRDGSFTGEGEQAGTGLIDLVIAMVKRDPSMRYSVGNIARAACITPNHFSTLFHKHTGETFRGFLTRQRIGLAQSLLADPSYTVADVARRAGFDDPAYFSRRFRQVTGVAPTAWRKHPSP